MTSAAKRGRFLAYYEADQHPTFEEREQAITDQIRAAETEVHNKAVEACAKLCDGKRLTANNWQKDIETWKKSELTDKADVYSYGSEQMAKDIAKSMRALKREPKP